MRTSTTSRAGRVLLPIDQVPADEDGHSGVDTLSSPAVPDQTPGANVGLQSILPVPQAAAEEIARQIRELHRRASFCTAQRVSMGNRLTAFVRVEFLGFSTFGDAEAREKQKKMAQKLVAAARKGEEVDLPEVQAAALKALIAGTDAAILPFEQIEEACLKSMEKLTKDLPGYAFVVGVRGFGARSFARIVGEAGALHRYANPAKLWKRLGLAVIGGERQRRYTDAELAVIHGYNPRRRSVSWVAFEALMKAQGLGDDAGPYRKFYDVKKEEYLAREGWTKIHAHRAAARYAEKKLLRDLWQAWRSELRGQASFGVHHGDAPHSSFGDQTATDDQALRVADSVAGPLRQ